MKAGTKIILNGVGFILFSLLLSSIYEGIVESNRSEYNEKLELNPHIPNVDLVELKGKNQINLGIHGRDATPIQVELFTANDEKVGRFTSQDEFDYVTIDNPFPSGTFTVISTNFGEESKEVIISVRDVREPGTYIDTTELSWILVISSTIGLIGWIILIIGIIMWLTERRKTRKLIK